MKKYLISLLTFLSLGVAAQTYPQREITIVNPTVTGSAQWTLLNTVTTFMSNSNGYKFKILDKPGADKLIGANFSAEAAPDGYTLHLGSQTEMIILPILNPPGIRYTEKSFIPVANIGSLSPLLVVPLSFPANNLTEFLDIVRKDPNSCSIGTPGSLTKLMAIRLCSLAGAEHNDIPYPGDNKMVIDLAGGHLPAGIMSFISAQNLLSSGKIKVIASFGSTRSIELPLVSTINEIYPGFVETWSWGIFAPKGTPIEIVNSLNREFNIALNNPKLIEELAIKGYSLEPMTVNQFAKYYQSSVKKFKPNVEKYLK